MGLFDLFKPKTKAGSDVLESLLGAAEKQDAEQLASLCEGHRDEIRGRFVEWSKVPKAVRKDRAARDRYAKGLIAVAQLLELRGDASLISHLLRKPSENPIDQWQNDLYAAQSLIDGGKFAEAIVSLEGILAKNATLLGGTGVDFYLPRTLGMLGAAYFRGGDADKTRECMSKAKALCEESGDAEGVRIYEGNLRHLTSIEGENK